MDLFDYVPPAAPAPPSQREQGLAGMEQAADHAEDDAPGWRDEALEYLIRFAIEHRYRDFLAEEIAPWADERGCSAPPDKRAWGQPVNRAGRLKIIEQTGLAAKNKLSGNDSTWRPLWRAGPNLDSEAAKRRIAPGC